MKKLEEILSILKENKDNLKKHFYIDKIGIFGSYSRQEQTSESDIDILVSMKHWSFNWYFLDLKEFLEEILKGKVDLANKDSLKPHLKDKILKEAIFI